MSSGLVARAQYTVRDPRRVDSGMVAQAQYLRSLVAQAQLPKKHELGQEAQANARHARHTPMLGVPSHPI